MAQAWVLEIKRQRRKRESSSARTEVLGSNLCRVIFTNVRPRCANVRSGVRTFVRTNVRSTNVRPGDRTFVPGVGHRACGFEPGMLASNVRTRGTNARPTNVRSRARCERSSVERSLRIDERSPPRNERSSPVSERSSTLRTFAHIHSDFCSHTAGDQSRSGGSGAPPEKWQGQGNRKQASDRKGKVWTGAERCAPRPPTRPLSEWRFGTIRHRHSSDHEPG